MIVAFFLCGMLQKDTTPFFLLGSLGTRSGMVAPPRVDHPDQVKEDLVDVGVGFGRSLFEGTTKLGGQGLALLGGDLTLGDCIDLVADQDDGDVQLLLVGPQDVGAQLGGSLEAS